MGFFVDVPRHRNEESLSWGSNPGTTVTTPCATAMEHGCPATHEAFGPGTTANMSKATTSVLAHPDNLKTYTNDRNNS